MPINKVSRIAIPEGAALLRFEGRKDMIRSDDGSLWSITPFKDEPTHYSKSIDLKQMIISSGGLIQKKE